MKELKYELLREKAIRNKPESSNSVKKAGLCISVYEAEEAKVGTSGHDFVYWPGICTSIIQLVIAAIPYGLFGDWGIFLITVVGIILSFVTGSLPQWREEKWACRGKSDKDMILTRGNGSQHAILILGKGKGFDLETLATGRDRTSFSNPKATRISLVILAALWVLLLITAAGIKENTWFLLAIGGLGLAENAFVAGTMRTPSAYGMSLSFVEVIGKPKVMDSLFEVEKKYPHAGLSMVGIFFPGGKLRQDEKEKWDALKKNAEEREKDAKESYKTRTEQNGS
ncbi:hypothetical protein CMQ_6083 [Grosmannia clavigera kw1407]|uniref:Uncharacterized protein n=1 Tax=Grosmannia clavigera (strain kw1407 / UAMH 11150) TaxID=655863 RepID=F0XLE1_GROCL|nr:uncharacterized protein CMQ_6083 [Grosmannia clavigera kw1407]EFX01141.1 hypothetical protein CMQ_6083 [Grosmannia clavigera kw1407]